MLYKNYFKYLALIAGLVLMGLLSTFSMSFAQGDNWTTKAPMSLAREGYASCVLDGKIYIMGGTTKASYPSAVTMVEIFDPKSNTWSVGKELPVRRYDASASVVNGKIYIMGGKLWFGMYGYISNVHEFDPANQTWIEKRPIPTPRTGLATCVVDQTIYAIGGSYAPDYLGIVEVYDPTTDSWTRKKDMSTPRAFHEAVVCNGKIYVMGGEYSTGGSISIVEEYNPMTDTWARKTDIPTARMLLGAEAANGMIYAMGGIPSGMGSEQSLNINEEYDPETSTWVTRANLPTPRSCFSSHVLDNKIYVIGGLQYFNPTSSGTYEASVEEYVPPMPAPYIIYHSCIIDDSEGDKDENLDPGESVKLILGLRNIRFDAVNISATLRSEDPDVQITQATANFGDMPRSQSTSNQNNPFIFSVAATCKPHFSMFYLDISGGGGYARIDSIKMLVGTPDYLLVDDDGGATYEDYYLKCLPQAKWDVSARGCPTLSVAQSYKAIIWFTGDEREEVLDSDKQAFLVSYLDNGGRLFLTGQNIGYDLIQTGSSSDSAFYTNYLHAQYISDSTNVTSLKGVAGDPITKGLSYLFTGDYGAGNQTAPDVIAPIAPAATIFNYRPANIGAALRYEDPVKNYRLVYFAFGFEGIAGPNIDSAQKLMTNILTWLQGTTAVHQFSDSRLPKDFVLEQNYPNPFNPTTTIGYSLANDSQVRLTVYNTLGQVVAVLVDGYQAKGSYRVKWDGHNQPSGIYLYKLEAGGFSAARKMFLQK